MIVPIPPEVIVALIISGLIVLAVVVIEIVVFLRGAASAHLRPVELVLIICGAAIGIAHSAVEWIEPSLSRIGVPMALAVVVGVLIATALVAVRPRDKLIVALLGAGLLYQFGFIGGRFVLPSFPVIGDALGQARCERDPYCLPPSQQTTGQVELSVQTPAGDTVARGDVSCSVDPRPNAVTLMALNGVLDADDGGEIQLDVQVSTSYDAEMPEPSFYIYLDGPFGGFEHVSGEAVNARWTLADPSGPTAASLGTITFDGLRMESLQPDPDLGGEQMWRHEPTLDESSGTLIWDCT